MVSTYCHSSYTAREMASTLLSIKGPLSYVWLFNQHSIQWGSESPTEAAKAPTKASTLEASNKKALGSLWRIKLTTEALFGDRKTEKEIERKTQGKRERERVLSGQKLYVILSKKSKTRRNTYSTFFLLISFPSQPHPRPSLSQLSAQRLRQNMPQSGCKTFSFIFKYKKAAAELAAAAEAAGAAAFSIMFRCFSGGQLIDAHARRRRVRGEGGG